MTTSFPVPEVDDGAKHVYVSVGHQQMMTDALTPLGLSMRQLGSLRPMAVAGGRQFVDITELLASRASRATWLDTLGRSDPLMRDAVQTVLDRGDIVDVSDDVDASADEDHAAPPVEAPLPDAPDPGVLGDLIAAYDAAIAQLERDLAAVTGEARFERILTDIEDMKRMVLDPLGHRALMAGFEATWWINDRLEEWLGERNAADVLTRAAPGNPTSEMGLALLDVADEIRPHPAVVALLRRVEAGGGAGDRTRDDTGDETGDGFLHEMATLDGGVASQAALRAFLDRYGMRCVGEIDISRPRWSEQPSTLVPLILGNVDNAAPGDAARRVEQGRAEAARWEDDILRRLRALPDGEAKARDTKTMIEQMRAFIGFREYPKFAMVRRAFAYKNALLQEARRLVQDGVLHDETDIFSLTFDEVRQAARTGQIDPNLIAERQAELAAWQALTPPRVLTSDGGAFDGEHRRRDVPAGALAGLAVSAGVVEGRARIVEDIATADLQPGDILVTAHTDPSWSPLFVAAAGLVTEVGGLMTHGAVVAREYGLPAVVGVDDATRLIADGQTIRVDGTRGYVELLP